MIQFILTKSTVKTSQKSNIYDYTERSVCYYGSFSTVHCNSNGWNQI